MTAKILTPTGKVVHRSTYRALMPEELADPVEQDCMKAFLRKADEQWVGRLNRGHLEEVGLIDTPDTDPYLDNQQTNKTFPAIKEEVIPKTGGGYIQASIMIPKGNTFAHGTVVSCKRKAEGKIIGHAHDNPILDSRLYDIEFADGKVTALTINAIAKAMYAQCDPDGNAYILLDKLIDVKRTEDALLLEQQKITITVPPATVSPQRVGSFVADVRMAPPLGKSCPIVKSPILFRYKCALH